MVNISTRLVVFREDACLVFHIVGILRLKSRHMNYFVSSVFIVGREGWDRREDVWAY